jgi:hypothetical protein
MYLWDLKPKQSTLHMEIMAGAHTIQASIAEGEEVTYEQLSQTMHPDLWLLAVVVVVALAVVQVGA